jgi:hypothetical protein
MFNNIKFRKRNMETFNEQLKNNRLKTLSRDILNQPSGIGQRWDTYGISEATMLSANFWDVAKRPLQTNNVIEVTLHGEDDDSAQLGSFRALAGYAKVIGGDKYASQLIKLGWGDDFCTLDIANLRQYAGVTQTFPFGFHATVQPSMFYVFVDAEKVGGGSVVLKDGTTTLTTVTLLANDGYGKMYSYDASGATPASTFSLSFTGAAGELSTGNIHAVMVGNYQLPASN